MLEREIHQRLRDHRGYQTIQQINGVGRTLGTIFVVEIGDVTRFATPQALCSCGTDPETQTVRPQVAKGKSQ